MNNHTLSIGEFFRLCLAKWKWFAASVAAVMLLAVAYLVVTPPKYMKKAQLFLTGGGRFLERLDRLVVVLVVDQFLGDGEDINHDMVLDHKVLCIDHLEVKGVPDNVTKVEVCPMIPLIPPSSLTSS